MTDLDRLRAWMERNGHGTNSLSKMLMYGDGRDYIGPMLAGRRPIRDTFCWRFAGVFGEKAHDEVFCEGVAQRAKRQGVDARHRIAHLAITSAITVGLLRHASTYKCVACDKTASVHHHGSYHPHDALCVVPMCGSCHKYHHNGSKTFPFGVVPTHVGLVRIAIARTCTQS